MFLLGVGCSAGGQGMHMHRKVKSCHSQVQMLVSLPITLLSSPPPHTLNLTLDYFVCCCFLLLSWEGGVALIFFEAPAEKWKAENREVLAE